MQTVMTVAALDVVRAVRAAFNYANSDQTLPMLGEQDILNHLVKRNVIGISMIKKSNTVMVTDIAATVLIPRKVVRQLRHIGIEFLTDLENVTYAELIGEKFMDPSLIAKLQDGMALFDLGLKGPAPAE